MIKIIITILLLFSPTLVIAQSNTSSSETVPNLDNNPANTSAINDRLYQMQNTIQELSSGIDINGGTTGILNVNRGGTGQDFSAVAANSIPYFSAIGVMGNIGIGTSGYVLTAGNPPVWLPPTHGIIVAVNGTYTWTAPIGVYEIYLTLQGAGSGGASDSAGACPGGSSGALMVNTFYPVIPGNSYTVVVGKGGASTTGASHLSNAGTSSSFDTNITVNGGQGATSVSGCAYTTGGGTVQSAIPPGAGSGHTGGSAGYALGTQYAGIQAVNSTDASGGAPAGSYFGAGVICNGSNPNVSGINPGTGGCGAITNGTSGAGADGYVSIQY